MVNSTCDNRQVKAHFSLDYESRVRGKNELLLYGNFSDPKGGKVRMPSVLHTLRTSRLVLHHSKDRRKVNCV